MFKRYGRGQPQVAGASPSSRGKGSALGLLKAAAIAVGIAGVSAPSPGQNAGAVSGTVQTAARLPLEHARVVLVGTDVVATTGSDGQFELLRVPTGEHVVEARLLGYSPARIAINVAPGSIAHLDFVLIVVPVVLPPVAAKAEETMSPGLRGFEERRARGAGQFFTKDDISRMQARQLTDILRRVPGVRLQSVVGPWGSGQTASTNRATSMGGARACPILYYVNGSPVQVTPDISINHYISPDDVAGIEVYSGTSRTPSQFGSSNNNARCGVVVIWTLDGKTDRHPEHRSVRYGVGR